MIYYLHVNANHPDFSGAIKSVEDEFKIAYPNNNLSVVYNPDQTQAFIKVAGLRESFIQAAYQSALSSGLLIAVYTPDTLQEAKDMVDSWNV